MGRNAYPGIIFNIHTCPMGKRVKLDRVEEDYEQEEEEYSPDAY
jgi:hypothetical protein